MCLIDKKQFRVAEQDIPIFKVVLDGHFSPLKNTRLFRVNYITNTVQFARDTLEEYQPRNDSGYVFDINYYHALTSRKRAEEFLKNISQYYLSTDKLTIVEGYIPPFTRYAIDVNGNYICARRMILNI